MYGLRDSDESYEVFKRFQKDADFVELKATSKGPLVRVTFYEYEHEYIFILGAGMSEYSMGDIFSECECSSSYGRRNREFLCKLFKILLSHQQFSSMVISSYH